MMAPPPPPAPMHPSVLQMGVPLAMPMPGLAAPHIMRLPTLLNAGPGVILPQGLNPIVPTTPMPLLGPDACISPSVGPRPFGPSTSSLAALRPPPVRSLPVAAPEIARRSFRPPAPLPSGPRAFSLVTRGSTSAETAHTPAILGGSPPNLQGLPVVSKEVVDDIADAWLAVVDIVVIGGGIALPDTLQASGRLASDKVSSRMQAICSDLSKERAAAAELDSLINGAGVGVPKPRDEDLQAILAAADADCASTQTEAAKQAALLEAELAAATAEVPLDVERNEAAPLAEDSPGVPPRSCELTSLELLKAMTNGNCDETAEPVDAQPVAGYAKVSIMHRAVENAKANIRASTVATSGVPKEDALKSIHESDAVSTIGGSIYLGNIPRGTSDGLIVSECRKFGAVTSIFYDADDVDILGGGWALVHFVSKDNADAAVQKLSRRAGLFGATQPLEVRLSTPEDTLRTKRHRSITDDSETLAAMKLSFPTGEVAALTQIGHDARVAGGASARESRSRSTRKTKSDSRKERDRDRDRGSAKRRDRDRRKQKEDAERDRREKHRGRKRRCSRGHSSDTSKGSSRERSKGRRRRSSSSDTKSSTGSSNESAAESRSEIRRSSLSGLKGFDAKASAKPTNLPITPAVSSTASPAADTSKNSSVVPFEEPSGGRQVGIRGTWAEFATPDGRTYYVNILTLEKQWQRPPSFDSIASRRPGAPGVGKGHSNLYVGNLPLGIHEVSFRQLFEQHGNIISIKLLPSKKAGGNDYGFVKYSSVQEAQAAINMMHGCECNGSKLSVKFALEDKKY